MVSHLPARFKFGLDIQDRTSRRVTPGLRKSGKLQVSVVLFSVHNFISEVNTKNVVWTINQEIPRLRYFPYIVNILHRHPDGHEEE